jgi:hypothetical protein
VAPPENQELNRENKSQPSVSGEIDILDAKTIIHHQLFMVIEFTA